MNNDEGQRANEETRQRATSLDRYLDRLLTDLSATLAMTSVTRTVGGSSCLLCRSIIIFNQYHDGVCCYYILRVLHLGYPVAMPAAAFYQFIKTHYTMGKLIMQINLWLSRERYTT